MAVKFQDLLEAFQLSGDMITSCVDRLTGQTYYESDDDPSLSDELPPDPDGERLLALPDKRDLGLGKPLALDFARSVLPSDFDEVRDIFSRRGAYRRCESFLIRRRALDDWRDFSNKAEEAALRAWCEDEGLEVED